MAGVENEGFENEGTSQKDTSAILNIDKQKYYKITKSGEVKLPRKVLHCSDGVYEEYSTSEDEEEIKPVIDPKTLTWGPYLWYWTTASATKGLAVCDYLGEKLAWFFGITSPRYQYALDEVERMREEAMEQEEQEKEEREAELQFVKATHSSQASSIKGYGSSEQQSATLEVSSVNIDEKGDQ